MSGRRFVHHWKTAIAVSLLAFASGAVVGVAGTLHFVSNNLHRFIENPEKMPERMVAHLRRELHLGDEQAAQILAIFEHSQQQLRSIRKDVEPRIDLIVQGTFDEVSRTLKPEQQQPWKDWFDMMKRKFTPPDMDKDGPAKPAS